MNAVITNLLPWLIFLGLPLIAVLAFAPRMLRTQQLIAAALERIAEQPRGNSDHRV